MQPEIVKKRLLISAISAPVAMGVLTVILLWHLKVQRIYTHWLEHSQQVLNEAWSRRAGFWKCRALFEDTWLSRSLTI